MSLAVGPPHFIAECDAVGEEGKATDLEEVLVLRSRPELLKGARPHSVKLKAHLDDVVRALSPDGVAVSNMLNVRHGPFSPVCDCQRCHAERQIGVSPRVYARSVNFAAGPPSKWSLAMTDGSDVEVWANSYREEAGNFVFSVLVDATIEEQHQLDVTGRTPTRPERVIVTVCRVPVSTVTGPPTSA